MDHTYWKRQTDTPLHPELEWDKPERRDQAGKLLLVGGNINSLTAPAKSYDMIRQAGIGKARIVLPDKTKSLVGNALPEALFLPSTTSGEFSHDGIQELQVHASWADAVLIAGDTGRNSQTTILLEDLARIYNGRLVITRDALDSLSASSAQLLERPETTLVLSFAQLQKLAKNAKLPTALTFSMSLVQLVDYLHLLTGQYDICIVTLYQNQLITATKGEVCTTKMPQGEEPKQWRTAAASLAACYQTWYPNKPFEALAQTAHACIAQIGPVR